MSEQVPYAVRQRVFNIRQDLDRLAGEKRSIEFTVAASPESDYLLNQLPGIDALCHELETELDILEAEAKPKSVPPEPALSVAETEQHLAQLLARIDASDHELMVVRHRLPGLRTAYEHVVIHGDADVNEAFSELETARHLEAELVSSSTILRSAIPAVKTDLERAKAARSEREREHWAGIAGELTGIERWCCLIRAHGRPGVIVDWDPTWGNRPTAEQRVATMAMLAQKYPFRDASDGNITV
jgi:hypothetical protein